MRNLWQFLKFAVVGVSNTLISEIIYGILVYFDVPYLPAYFIGFVISVLNAYYWSNKYVFKAQEGVKRTWWKVLLKTYIAYSWGFLVSAVLLVFWIDIVQISQYLAGVAIFLQKKGLQSMDAKFLGEILAAGINLLITVPMNFLVNKFWAYKNEKSNRMAE